MLGEIFEIYTSQMARMSFKLSTMVGENFEIYTSQMARMFFNCPPYLEKILKFTVLKWIKMQLKCVFSTEKR